MLSVRDISVKIGIPSSNLGNDIERIIIEKAKNTVLKKEIKNVGLVCDIEQFKYITGGEISLTSGISQFVVAMSVKLYIPKIGEQLKTTVTDICLHGYYVNEPVQTFVGTSSKPIVKTGDVVIIKITKVGFNKGRFVVIARQVDKN